MDVTPHVAQNTCGRSAAIDGRTTRHGQLCHQPTHSQADRAGIRQDQDSRAENRRPASATVIASHGPLPSTATARALVRLSKRMMRVTAEAREGAGRSGSPRQQLSWIAFGLTTVEPKHEQRGKQRHRRRQKHHPEQDECCVGFVKDNAGDPGRQSPARACERS